MKPAIRMQLSALIAGLILVSVLSEAQTFTVLHSFTNSPDGADPWAGLILSGNTLYGTTAGGGTNGPGSVFAINTDGSEFRILHSFGPDPSALFYTNSDGMDLEAPLLLANGVLYGTTYYGGTNGSGAAFAVNTDGTGFTNLHIFGGGNDGVYPRGGLVLAGNVLYGTTGHGGTNGNGTVFVVNTNDGSYADIYSFSAIPWPDPIPTNAEGAGPDSSLILIGTNLYGTASAGGTNSYGTVFVMNVNNVGVTALHHFTFNDGCNPIAGLILSDDILYGTTYNGGANAYGTVFAINKDGTGFTNLYEFTGGNDGSKPWSGLALYGNTLYGTTVAGGTNGNGTVFAINKDGTGFSCLHSFTALSSPYHGTGTNCDGANPYGGLVISGQLAYGTAAFGGSGAQGTIFSLTLPLPPELNIACAGANVVLTWPTNAIVYTLQSATNLIPPVVWNPVSPSPAIVNGQNTVTNPLAATQMFYRLSQ